MVILQFSQNDKTIHFGVFASINEGRKLVEKIPGYYIEYEKIDTFVYEYEYIDTKQLPEYLEIPFHQNKAIFTKFMFDDSTVTIDWIDILDFTKNGCNGSQLCTIVDAYAIPNKEVANYIQKREAKVNVATELLTNAGFKVERAFRGSEDGEALVVYDHKGVFRLFSHLDPQFVEADVNELVTTFLKEV